MKKIAMVVGEDFWLRIPMNNESAGRHLCMDDVEVIHAWLESGYGGCWTLPLETDGEQLEGVAVKVPGSRLGLGTYAVVMAGKFVNGGHFRTKRQLFIRLVDREEQADAKPTMFNEEKAYWAGPAVLSGMLSRDGLNTYELAVLHGYDGTLEQFLAQAGIELQDLMVTKEKLSREVQTQLDKGSEKAITPAGDYDDETEYSVNEMVYDEVTNSSYVSKQSVNVGHAVTDTDWWMKVLDGNYVHTTIQAIMTAAQATLDEAKQDTINATAAALAAKQATEQATLEANSVVAQKVADAQIGYYVCETAAGTATKQTTSDMIGQNQFAVPAAGGAVKIKMEHANTSTDAVYLQFGTNTNTKRRLYYNGEDVSQSNTWDDGEVISVYLDPAANNGAGGYMASNAKGSGGKAEKIKYDNSTSGLAAENVQGAVDSISDNIFTFFDVNFIDNTSSIGWSINTINGKWLNSSACRILAIDKNSIYTIKAGEQAVNYALLESNTPVPDQIATDYNGGIPITIDAGESAIINSGKYGFLYCRFLSGTFANPEYVKKHLSLDEYIQKNTSVIDLSNLRQMRGLIRASDGVWIYDANAKYALIDISAHAGGRMCITSGQIAFVIGFLRHRTYAYGSPADFCTGTALKGALGKAYIDVPSSARYLYISTINTNGDDRTPVSIEVYGGYVSNSDIPEYWEIVRRKIHQYSNLVWTSLGRVGGSYSYCTAGVKTGMLYGSSVQVDRYVGFDITLKTFMTLANNPYSLLYTDSPGNKVSGYGFTYVRTEASKAWAGTVCSRFLLNCLGSPIEWETAHFKYLCQVGTLIKSRSQQARDVQIGDLIWVPGHTRMIYDVVKSGNEVTTIVVCEAVSTSGSPLVTSVIYTPSTLDAYMSSEGGIFYKWNGKRGMIYEPSEFINNYDEPLPEDYQYNDDICTYAGDYAAFRVGYPVWLNYNLKSVGSWTQIELYKDNTLVNTYTIDTSINRLQIPAADIMDSGFYKARMTDGTAYSDYTYFEVIDTTVSVSTPDAAVPAIKKVQFSSENGYPVQLIVCDNAGGPYGRVPLTMQDAGNGFVTVDVERLSIVQLGTPLGNNARYIKVYFKGEYGRVSSELIEFEL